MALKKSELYASLWASCDELRGGMDASRYKDYVLVLLFIKYVSDKYAGKPFAAITVPEGASFKDMVALKGKPDIGDQINKKIIAPLAGANRLSDLPDFNDANMLGSGKEMVERLTNLIAIFENKALDFSSNRADGDDILGDAYEYLMRQFATESGKSKGQFYTPAEVSRVMAQIIGIGSTPTASTTTVYDPTCGSGSLLLKVADAANGQVTLYGQEKDATTAGLARMNMILHSYPTALVMQGNTLTDPKYMDGPGGNATLKTFDYVVANPPFSDKRWGNGLGDPLDDPYERFKPFGVPPAKQGDYAYLLHIVRSLKSTGSGACILPHGVLFRGNAEAQIRRALVRKGYLKAIIGLPANLFYGTGIPACIVLIDKRDAVGRKGVFMIDASKGFAKDGPKNRLREQDIHRIVDAFRKQTDVPRYARMVSFEEIADAKNDYNLNLPRYIDSSDPEDLHDLTAHLRGGIPERDVDALVDYWQVMPQLRSVLFAADPASVGRTSVRQPNLAVGMNADLQTPPDPVGRASARQANLNVGMNADLQTPPDLVGRASARQANLDVGINADPQALQVAEASAGYSPTGPALGERAGYVYLQPPMADVRTTILNHPEFAAFTESVTRIFKDWRQQATQQLAAFDAASPPKALIETISESLLAAFKAAPLLNPYDVYQHLMDYWADTMQDDAYLIAADGWVATPTRIIETNKKGQTKDKGWVCELIPKPLIVARYFADQQSAIDTLQTELEAASASLTELEEEHSGDDAVFTGFDTINAASVKDRVREIGQDADAADERTVLKQWLKLSEQISADKKRLKAAEAELDALAYAKYPDLSEAEIKALVIDDKWMATIAADVQGELARVSQTLTGRIRELAERYDTPLPQLTDEVAVLSARVEQHLVRMGVSWA
ncbi:type I restriction-modification system subunit M [Polycyclovorans algicola]|uniref:type I restriction-modification system subunit M n=1 Tax=Polycyclovorans algicola TaxID=616992 RepID=UPI0004A6EF4D|nr:type I restriction-modification system subunit M [Polycyclovorans algicola]